MFTITIKSGEKTDFTVSKYPHEIEYIGVSQSAKFFKQKEKNKMAKAKVLAGQVRNLEEEIQQKQNLLKELRNRYRVQEDKERTHRLIERGAILESLVEDAEILTNDQIKMFLIKTIQTDFARKVLTQFKEQNGEDTGEKSESEQVTLDEG